MGAGAAVEVADAPSSPVGIESPAGKMKRQPAVGSATENGRLRSPGLPPRAPSPDSPAVARTAFGPSRLSPVRGSDTGTGDASTSAQIETKPVSPPSLRRRARRVSDSDAFDGRMGGVVGFDEGRGGVNVVSGTNTGIPPKVDVPPRSLDDTEVRSPRASSLDQSSYQKSQGFRSRVQSFQSLIQDTAAGKISLKAAAQMAHSTLEAYSEKFAGQGGVEIYRFAWERFTRRVVFHIVFYSSLGLVLGIAAAFCAWQIWLSIGHYVVRRFIGVIFSLAILAMLPPSFPNAAAHALSLALVAAELVLVGINLILFALVHLAVFLNKYVLPHWFHNARSTFSEITSGVVDTQGRANTKSAMQRRDLLNLLDCATTYADYKRYATTLDSFPIDQGEGGDAWKRDDDGSTVGSSYDAELVKIYRDTCRGARLAKDTNRLGLALRTVLHRNFGGIDRLARTRHARVGTKKSAQSFIDELNLSITFLGEVGVDTASITDQMHSNLSQLEPILSKVKDTLRLVSETHRSLGRTALCLSGGGALAMYHFGVIKTLLEQGLLPKVISGTSGGSIVAAFISMFPEDELLKSINSDLSSKHGVRWFPPVWKMALHFARSGVLMDSAEFANTTQTYFGDVTFAEAFAISKRAVSIQVSVGSGHGFVLNHFTAPQVVVRTAVNASCALPGLMEPFELLAKDENTGALIPFHPPGVSSFDGTITADIPSARLTELFNCNNFIVSQVNPHVNFVLHLAEEGQGKRGGGRIARGGDRRAAVTKLLRVANFLLLNIKYGVQKLLEVDLLNLRMVRTLQGILVQDFRGHITVLPELKIRDYWRVLQHPSNDDMAKFINGGEKATWPHVEAVRTSTTFEIALTEAATVLRGRVRELEERVSKLKEDQKRESPNLGREKRTSRDGMNSESPNRAASDGGFDSDGSLVSAGSGAEGDDAHLGAGLSCAVETTAWH